MKHSIRYYFARALSVAADFLLDAAIWVSGQKIEQLEDEDVDAIWYSTELHHDFPCLGCKGKGFRKTADGDSYRCPDCLGSKLNLGLLLKMKKESRL